MEKNWRRIIRQDLEKNERRIKEEIESPQRRIRENQRRIGEELEKNYKRIREELEKSSRGIRNHKQIATLHVLIVQLTTCRCAGAIAAVVGNLLMCKCNCSCRKQLAELQVPKHSTRRQLAYLQVADDKCRRQPASMQAVAERCAWEFAALQVAYDSCNCICTSASCLRQLRLHLHICKLPAKQLTHAMLQSMYDV